MKTKYTHLGPLSFKTIPNSEAGIGTTGTPPVAAVAHSGVSLSGMNTKHTPGPWSAAYWKNGVAWQICDASSNCIATLVSDAYITGRREHEANARLIAAAPQMYEALRGIVDALGGECFDFGPARAAIAAAEGQP